MGDSKFLCIILCAGIILLIIPLYAQLANTPWPMFQHDEQHTGRSNYTGPVHGYFVWSYCTDEYHSSSEYINPPPAIGTLGEVYLTTYGPNFFALSHEGQLMWSFEGCWSRSSPALDSNGSIYIARPVGIRDALFAFASRGGLLWSYVIDWGIKSSPTIGPDDQIILGAYDYEEASFGKCGRLYVLNTSGIFLWSYETSGEIESSPAMDSNGRIYVGDFDSNIYTLNSTGRLLWTYETGDEIKSSPSVSANNTCYIGSRDNRLYAINSNGTIFWSYETYYDVDSCPAIGINEEVYLASPKMYALSSAGSLLWQYNTANIGFPEIPSSCIIDSSGQVYNVSSWGVIYAFAPDGVLNWAFVTNERELNSPVIGLEEKLYVSSYNRLYCFDDSGHASNYVNLEVEPAAVTAGGLITLRWSCTDSNWNYERVPVEVYLAVRRAPNNANCPSSVSDFLYGWESVNNEVFFFSKGMRKLYWYKGKVWEPTFRNVVLHNGDSGEFKFKVWPYLGKCSFGVAFVNQNTGQFIRTDGLPVENSNSFIIGYDHL